MPGSVPSEREFKMATQISQGDRIRLLPTNTNIEKLLFLKYNLRAIGFGSFKLPQQNSEVILPNHNLEVQLNDGDDKSIGQIE